MQAKNWPLPVRVQHWLTVLLMLICLGAVWGHEAFDKTDPLRGQLMQLHLLTGLLLGALTLPRLLTRLLTQAPAHVMSPMISLLAKAGHLGLYLLLLSLPVCGYIAVSGKGSPINLLGLVDLPPLPVTKDIAHTFKELHEGLANALIALVVLHVGAVIFHAVVLKDKVLQSMTGRLPD